MPYYIPPRPSLLGFLCWWINKSCLGSRNFLPITLEFRINVQNSYFILRYSLQDVAIWNTDAVHNIKWKHLHAYCISSYSFRSWIVSSHLCTVTFGFPNPKKNSFRGNYMRKYYNNKNLKNDNIIRIIFFSAGSAAFIWIQKLFKSWTSETVGNIHWKLIRSSALCSWPTGLSSLCTV